MINFKAFHAPDADIKIDFFLSIIDAIINDSRSTGIDELPMPQRAEAFAQTIVDAEITPDAVCMIASLCLARMVETPKTAEEMDASPSTGA